MPDAKSLFQVAQSLYQSDDNRQALQQLDDAKRENDFASLEIGAYEDLRKEVLSSMRMFSEQAEQELQVILQNPTEIDVEAAAAAVAKWERNTVNANDPILAARRKQITDYTTNREGQELFRRIDAEVKRYWEQGKAESRKPNSVTAQILSYFTQARDFVQGIAATYPDNADIQELAARANEQRTRIAQEQEAMLSGAQANRIKASLDHIDKTPTDELIPVYDEFGTPKGRMSKGEARAIYEDLARKIAHNAVTGYIDKARRELRQGLPLSAREALKEREKNFGDLETMVTSLLSDDTLRQIERFEVEITSAEKLLRRAEEGADRAAENATDDPVSAYREYQRALELYVGAQHSSVVQRAEPTIKEAARQYLDDKLTLLNALGKIETQRDYFTRDILGEIIRQGQEIIQAYESDETNLAVSDRLDRIRREVTQAQRIQNRIGALNAQLEDVETLIQNDPKGADRALRELEFGNEKALLEVNPRYSDLRGKINMRVNKQQELVRLRGFLNNPDIEQVREAIDQARKNSAENSEFRDAFEKLLTNLQAYAALINADTLIRTQGYDSVLPELKRFAESIAIDAELARRIQDKLTGLDDQARLIGADQAKLKTADELLKNNQYGEAYRLLEQVRNFTNFSERTRHRELLTQAQTAWAGAIYMQLLALKIDSEFTASWLREQQTILMEIAPERVAPLRQRLNLFEGVQLVREAIENREFNTAQSQLDVVKRDATATERLYIDSLNNQINNAQIQEEKQRLIDRLPAAVRDAEVLRDVTTKLIELTERLNKLVNETRDPIAKMQYMAWQIELTLEHGQYTNDAATRRDLFSRAQVISLSLKADIQLEEASPHKGLARERALLDAKRMMRRAGAAPEIARAMQQLDQYFKVEERFDPFREAVDLWNEVFTDYREDFTRLNDWFEDRKKQVTNNINMQIGVLNNQSGKNTIKIADLPLYAKLLLLNSKDEQGGRMLRDLPALTEQLRKDVNLLRDEILGEKGYPPVTAGESFDLIDQQMDQLNRRRDSVDLLRSIARSFSSSPQLRGEGSTLETNASSLVTRLEDDLGKMRRFQERVVKFRSYIENFSLTSDEERSWESANDLFDDEWERFITSIEEIHSTLSDHPVMDALKNEMTTKRGEINDMVTKLIDLRNALGDEDFELADTRLQDFVKAKYERALQRMPLYAQYTVRDEWRQSDVIGWDEVKLFANERILWFSRLSAWMRPFGAPSDAKDLNQASLTHKTPPNVVSWQLANDSARKLMNTDLDSDWKAIVEAARDQVDDKEMGLAQAFNIVSNPPLAMTGGTTNKYEEAARSAGSQRGARLIRWMQKYRYEQIKQWLDEANQLIGVGMSNEDEWMRVVSQLAGFINRMEEVLEQGKGLFKRLDTNMLRELVNNAETSLSKLRKISPHHPKISVYEEDETLNEARQKISGKRS